MYLGDYAPVVTKGTLLTFLRRHGDKRFLVLLNLSHRPALFRSEHTLYAGNIVLATDPEREGRHVEKNISLSGDEGIVVALD